MWGRAAATCGLWFRDDGSESIAFCCVTSHRSFKNQHFGVLVDISSLIIRVTLWRRTKSLPAIDQLFTMHVSLLVFTCIAGILLRICLPALKDFLSPLRGISGPLAARFGKLWWFNRVRQGRFQHDEIALHRRYGPIVRLAPRHYSIDDPDAVRTIYGAGSKFRKGDWYYAWQPPGDDKYSLFSDRNIKRHADTRKRFQALYSMTSVVSYEPLADKCADIFAERLDETIAASKSVDMAHWFQCYAFDVIAALTYGRRFGFLDRGEDLDGTIQEVDKITWHGTLIGIYTGLHDWLFNLATKFSWSGAKGRVTIGKFVQQQIGERLQQRQNLGVMNGQKKADDTKEDFLNRLLDLHEQDTEKHTRYHVFMVGLSNIMAGFDTTAVSLSAVLYYLLKNPQTMSKLKNELHEFTARGHQAKDISFKESQELPYFQAVVKEALRLHPATGLPLWRVVPEGGATIAGQLFPEGAVVGINAWVAHRNKEVYGSDADEFRPERWLEAETEAELGNKDMLRQMDTYYLPFGAGSRSCIGKNIALLEISKLIPRLVRDFDFCLEDPEREWDTRNFWFVRPERLSVRVQRAVEKLQAI